MNKTLKTFSLAAIAITSVITFGSCKDPAAGKASAPAQTKNEKTEAAAQSIAYVCIDTIINKYDFCTEHSKLLENRWNNLKASLDAKSNALQNSAMSFQKKVQSGEFTSQEQAAKVQKSLLKQQEELEKLQSKYSVQFEKERQKYNDEMRDSIESFLKDYNKDHKYSIILSKVENNILYAEKSMDITEDVLNGLNKRYKSSKKSK